MQPSYPKFQPGQGVRSVYGKHLIVAEQLGCQVFVKGSTDWYHPTKLIPESTGAKTKSKIHNPKTLGQ